jgi:dihydroxyacetone kinase-like predicted kinase
MLSGIVGALRGAAPAPLEHAAGARVTHPQHSSTTYRYCTNFVVTGSGLQARRCVPRLEALGDSVLVVGDAATLRVHLHTDSPNAATALFSGAGAVSHLDIADMRQPVAAGEERGFGARRHEVCGLVAVATGPGIRSLFESFGAHVLDAGDSATNGAHVLDGAPESKLRSADAARASNPRTPDGAAPPKPRTLGGDTSSGPSPYDLLAAIHAIDEEEVVVLPNSVGMLAAARRAAQLSEKTTYMVESRSHQAGLAAAAVMDPHLGARENAERMSRTIAHIRTGSVVPAEADDAGGRFQAGDALAFLGDELVAWGQPRDALRAVLERLADGAELITCLRGAGAPLDDRTVETLAAGEIEFELSDGGQRGAWWLLAAE